MAPAAIVLLLILMAFLDPQRSSMNLAEDPPMMAEALEPAGRYDRFMIRSGYRYEFPLTCRLEEMTSEVDHPGLFVLPSSWLKRGIQIRILEQSVSDTKIRTWGVGGRPLDLGMKPGELGDLLRTEVAKRYKKRTGTTLALDELRRTEATVHQLSARMALYLPRSLGKTGQGWRTEAGDHRRSAKGLSVDMPSAASQVYGLSFKVYSTDEPGRYLLKAPARGKCKELSSGGLPGFAAPVWVEP